ncbi:hypothetical protein CNEO4_1490006 [Clostridium neonatale]|nr:hypothetical protein CNEO4_1490006 [Clostridium neonatale]
MLPCKCKKNICINTIHNATKGSIKCNTKNLLIVGSLTVYPPHNQITNTGIEDNKLVMTVAPQ